MKKNLSFLLIPFICYGASSSSEIMPESSIVYGGRWATMVVDTQFMLLAERGLITPQRTAPTEAPKPPLHPRAVRPIKRHVEMNELTPSEGASMGIPSCMVPNVKRRLDFLSIGKKK